MRYHIDLIVHSATIPLAILYWYYSTYVFFHTRLITWILLALLRIYEEWFSNLHRGHISQTWTHKNVMVRGLTWLTIVRYTTTYMSPTMICGAPEYKRNCWNLKSNTRLTKVSYTRNIFLRFLLSVPVRWVRLWRARVQTKLLERDNLNQSR